MGIIDSVSRVHVIGAGGIGVSAVARLLLHEGKKVTGSDVARNETVDELIALGIPVAVGHHAANLPADADLVVYSDAVPKANPERAEAERRGIRQLSYFGFLGEFSKERWTVAVSGTNGKSTTTALLGLMLERAGFEPTVIVGSKVASFPGKNLRIGRGKHFVVEADEYNAHMLSLAPQMIVLTNIEEDHLDFYRDLAHIRDTFKEYVRRLPPDGQLVLNADDHVCFYELAPAVPFTTYAMDNPADYVARHAAVTTGMQTFQ
ncbi:MAG TPA: Mur ligase domain-containing protein, partial [Patescibacteria group bacterium]|nr:Mur ligase domain-containing protein [Patescibacteria group bacterium]